MATVSQAWPALGTKVSASADGGSSYVNIGQLVSVGNPGGGEVGERDTTVLSSVAHTNAPTIPDNGEVTISVNFDPTDAGHNQLISWKNSPPAQMPAWKVDFATVPATMASFSGWVKSIEPTAEGIDDNLTADITVRVSGGSTIGPGS
jgi:hypothetical protein